MLNKFIKELLEKHNRVIVPDLGAFLHKAETPQIIYFNEFLRFNDGLLVDYYAEKENIDKIEAAKKIKSLVDNINKELQTKKIYQIEGVGTLIIDTNEKIQLKTDIIKTYKAETESSKKQTESAKEKAEPKDEKTEKSISDKAIIELDKNAEKDKFITKEASKKTSTKQANSKQEITMTSEKKETEKLSQADADQNLRYLDESTTVYEKKGNKTVLWIIIVLLVLGGLAAGYFLYFKKYFTDNTINQNKVITSKPVEIVPKVEEQTEPPKENVGPVYQLSPPTGQYHVIAGCFVQENNADRFVKILSNQGILAEKFAKIDELYYVKVGSFDIERDAWKEFYKIRGEKGIQLWITKY